MTLLKILGTYVLILTAASLVEHLGLQLKVEFLVGYLIIGDLAKYYTEET